MNDNLFKPAAYAAKKRLIDSGFDVGSGHIHEIIAALQGYQSKAAFIADASQKPFSIAAAPVVVHVDIQLATDRAMMLLPGITGRKVSSPGDEKGQRDSAYGIAQSISECLEEASTSRLIFLRPMHISCKNSALKAYARAIAMADPVMTSIVDDPKFRHADAIDQGFSWGMAGLMAKHLGPLTFPFGSSSEREDQLHVELSSEYSTAEGESGVVHVNLVGSPFGRKTYTIDNVRVEFLEGEYFDDMPEYSGDFGEV